MLGSLCVPADIPIPWCSKRKCCWRLLLGGSRLLLPLQELYFACMTLRCYQQSDSTVSNYLVGGGSKRETYPSTNKEWHVRTS